MFLFFLRILLVFFYGTVQSNLQTLMDTYSQHKNQKYYFKQAEMAFLVGYHKFNTMLLSKKKTLFRNSSTIFINIQLPCVISSSLMLRANMNLKGTVLVSVS